jgi:hypothetical protein
VRARRDLASTLIKHGELEKSLASVVESGNKSIYIEFQCRLQIKN